MLKRPLYLVIVSMLTFMSYLHLKSVATTHEELLISVNVIDKFAPPEGSRGGTSDTNDSNDVAYLGHDDNSNVDHLGSDNDNGYVDEEAIIDNSNVDMKSYDGDDSVKDDNSNTNKTGSDDGNIGDDGNYGDDYQQTSDGRKEKNQMNMTEEVRDNKRSLTILFLIRQASLSCPPATSPTSVWTLVTSPEYVVGATHLARSILRHVSSPRPDLMAMILHPSLHPLDGASLSLLESSGWRLCHLPRLPPPRPMSRLYGGHFNKLHVWNMADYTSALFLDSDTYVRRDVSPLLHMASQLAPPGTRGREDVKGARIGVAHDYGMTALTGQWEDKFNSGVFLIRPGRRELFMKLLFQNMSCHFNSSVKVQTFSHFK